MTKLSTISAMLIGGLLLAAPLQAQTATPSKFLTWDQTGVSSVAEAQGFSYKYYSDNTNAGQPLAGVVCTGSVGGVVTCEAPFPAFTPGAHAITLTASNAAGESFKSSALNFTFQVIPNAPSNIGIR